MLGQDVVPKRKRGLRGPMSNFQHAAECKAVGGSCSQCDAGKSRRCAKVTSQESPALSATQSGGARKPPARQHQRQQIGLHFAQHQGVPQQAILASEVMVLVQKCSEIEARRVSPRTVQESGESFSGSGKSSGHAGSQDIALAAVAAH